MTTYPQEYCATFQDTKTGHYHELFLLADDIVQAKEAALEVNALGEQLQFEAIYPIHYV